MPFIICAKDKPNSTLRAQHRGAHLEFVATCREVFLYGGPMLDEGGRVVGSLSGREIFESRQIVPEVTPGSLDAELAKQRAAEAAK